MAIVIPTLRNYIYSDTDDGIVETSSCMVCTPACPFIFSAAGTKTTDGTLYIAYNFELTGLCMSSSQNLLVFWDSFASIGNEFALICDGVDIFRQLCTTGSGSGSATVPAGTRQFNAYCFGACNGVPGADQWSFQVGCVA